MFWSTSKQPAKSTPPDDEQNASAVSGVRRALGGVTERGQSHGDDESPAEAPPEEDARRPNLPRRQRPTPPESPSSKRGSDMPESDAPPEG